MTVAHTHSDRRQFLRGAFWTSLGGLSLLTLPMAAQRALAADSGARWDRTLVALQLNGVEAFPSGDLFEETNGRWTRACETTAALTRERGVFSEAD